MAKVARPLSSEAVPSTACPSSNVTLPVGVAAEPAVAVTVAVNVTTWPAVELSGDAVRVVVVAAWLTASTVVPLPVAKCGVAAVGRGDGVRAGGQGRDCEDGLAVGVERGGAEHGGPLLECHRTGRRARRPGPGSPWP